MLTYAVEDLDAVSLDWDTPLDQLDLMSPFVWKQADRYRMLFRGVPRPMTGTSPTGIIYSAQSTDGRRFVVDPRPAIEPGPESDTQGGCEDPTVVVCDDGRILVFFTGVDAARSQGAMVLAEGPDLAHLVKREVVLKAPPEEGNFKEATLARTPSGDWRLFYEYAAHDASRIGMAAGASPDGPWTVRADPFGIRADSWDNWHLSTGPMTLVPGHDPVMFYNGATNDARWRIGWITFDADFGEVTGRGVEPLILPPPAKKRDATDIAFAASTVVEGDAVALYYSLEDRKLVRAMVRRLAS